MKIIDEIVSAIKYNGNFCLIGIDGPTASGKTTLADNLRDELRKKKIPCFVYRLDWTLINRTRRLKDLDKLLSDNKAFEYEAGLHMKLNKARKFLKNIEKERHNEWLREKILHLSGLYSRDNDGKCIGQIDFVLKKKMVIIVEGHYTHHQLIRGYFDKNYLLVACPETLINRKSTRTSLYRGIDDVEKYFLLIDLPSFVHYYNQCK